VQKSNSHYVPQPYTDQSVLKSLLNCTSEISLSRNATGIGSGSALVFVSVVSLRRAWLVLGWVSVHGFKLRMHYLGIQPTTQVISAWSLVIPPEQVQ